MKVFLLNRQNDTKLNIVEVFGLIQDASDAQELPAGNDIDSNPQIANVVDYATVALQHKTTLFGEIEIADNDATFWVNRITKLLQIQVASIANEPPAAIVDDNDSFILFITIIQLLLFNLHQFSEEMQISEVDCHAGCHIIC